MSPPPAPEHGDYQSILVILLHQHLPKGKITSECPISTAGGVRAADVAWSSLERRSAQRGQKVLTLAPEICVEVLSPSNTRAEIEEKRSLYFEAGAEEVWICGLDGALRVFLRGAPDELSRSVLCPELPDRLPNE
jgi:Uma2 family endonuclease